MKLIEFTNEENYIKDFLSLPKKLYTKKDNMEDSNTMKSILLNKHPLSNDFKLNKYLVYKDDVVVARFIITEYPDDNKVCYIGFFECINDKKIAKFLFDEAEKIAKSKKYKKIIGPVDASFWIKYRLKINKFERPYTGEPYNKDYYLKLFTDNKYKVCDHYTSQEYNTVDETYNNVKFTEHFNEFKKLGYEIVKPKDEDFEKCMSETYDLITELYSDFPIFKNLKKESFLELYKSYKSIINMNMVRMAYFKGKAVGFYISVPNYHNIVYHLNPINILRIIHQRKHPKGYVMLYMGVDSNHRGLGKALVYSIVEELKKNNLPSIGALAHDGKINQNYASEKINSRYEYVLLERNI